jgi:hypothetical protein
LPVGGGIPGIIANLPVGGGMPGIIANLPVGGGIPGIIANLPVGGGIPGMAEAEIAETAPRTKANKTLERMNLTPGGLLPQARRARLTQTVHESYNKSTELREILRRLCQYRFRSRV